MQELDFECGKEALGHSGEGTVPGDRTLNAISDGLWARSFSYWRWHSVRVSVTDQDRPVGLAVANRALLRPLTHPARSRW
jgi:hypothetical protein